MKRNIVLLLFSLILIILFNFCEHDQINICPKDITGRWKWFITKTIYPTDTITPENTGIHEYLNINSEFTWNRIVDGMKIDSGSYSIGHGSFMRYPGAYVYTFDSIVFIRVGVNNITWDYYDIYNDTLQFCPGYAGKFAASNSYNFPEGFNGSKFLVRQNNH